MGNFFDTCKEIVEACKETDTTEYIEYQQQKKIHKYQKKQPNVTKEKYQKKTKKYFIICL